MLDSIGRGFAARSGTSARPDSTPSVQAQPAAAPAPDTIVIPGPLRSFLRMAAISQQVPNRDVLPMLARNVALWGHESGRETEYLVLLSRGQVRLAGRVDDLLAAHGQASLEDLALDYLRDNRTEVAQ